MIGWWEIDRWQITLKKKKRKTQKNQEAGWIICSSDKIRTQRWASWSTPPSISRFAVIPSGDWFTGTAVLAQSSTSENQALTGELSEANVPSVTGQPLKGGCRLVSSITSIPCYCSVIIFGNEMGKGAAGNSLWSPADCCSSCAIILSSSFYALRLTSWAQNEQKRVK